MKSENNGKIAIAIVAMFVVALSVVGFTYAYFVATIKGNTADKSAEVSAGNLHVVYGNGTKMSATNLVPGWKSDGKHYYDSVYSKTYENSIWKITAVSTDDTVTCKVSGTLTENTLIKNCDDAAVSSPDSTNGLVSPATFTVTEDTDNTDTVTYLIRLKDIVNSLAETDRSNLIVTLKQGDNEIWSGALESGETNHTTQVISTIQTLSHNATTPSSASYSVSLEYKDSGSDQSSSAGEKTVSFEVEVVGVQKKSTAADANSTTSTYYVDDSGNTVAPAIVTQQS